MSLRIPASPEHIADARSSRGMIAGKPEANESFRSSPSFGNLEFAVLVLRATVQRREHRVARGVERVLEFRRRVGEEFDRLVRESEEAGARRGHR